MLANKFLCTAEPEQEKLCPVNLVWILM